METHEFFYTGQAGDKERKLQHVLGLSNLAWSGLLTENLAHTQEKNAAVRRGEEEDCSREERSIRT